MPMLLICEKIKQWEQSLIAMLCDTYPVLLVQAIEKLSQNQILEQYQDLKGHLIVDFDSLDIALEEVQNIVCSMSTTGFKLILSKTFPFYDQLPSYSNGSELLLNPKDSKISFLKLISKSISSNPSPKTMIRYKNIEFSFENMFIRFLPDGEPENIPLKEARLLRILLQEPGKVWSREELQQTVWDRLKVSPRTIDSHISRLRKKLQYTGISIESKYGGGYSIT